MSPPAGAGSGAAPAEDAGAATSSPAIGDFLSFVGGTGVTGDAETSNARFDEAELAKSTHGDKLFPRTVVAVPETSVAELETEGAGPDVVEPQLPLAAHESAGAAEPTSPGWSNAAPVFENGEPIDEHFDLGAPIVDTEAELDDSVVPQHGDWNAEPWPVGEPMPPAVAARPTPHDLAAVEREDEDPFGWETPIAYHDHDAALSAGNASTDADPFAVLRDVPPYRSAAVDAVPPTEEAGELPDEPPTATVYAPDDADAWQASAAPSVRVESADAGGRAATMLADLADDVRHGRLRIDADANASPAGVLASLLATLLAPSRAG